MGCVFFLKFDQRTGRRVFNITPKSLKLERERERERVREREKGRDRER